MYRCWSLMEADWLKVFQLPTTNIYVILGWSYSSPLATKPGWQRASQTPWSEGPRPVR